MKKKQRQSLYRIIVSVTLTGIIYIVGKLINLKRYYSLPLFIVPYAIIGYDILKKAYKGILRLKPFDENFLMSLATIGAFILGNYLEAVAVMIFYQTGELFQSITVTKSRKNIGELLNIRPDYVNIKNELGEYEKTDPNSINVGDTFYALPDEKIALDGIVLEGTSSLNTSNLTGESLPKEVYCGDEVLSGCVNLNGVLTIKATKKFENSTASKIMELVENASSKKSKSENFITKFALIYTPIVVISAVILAILPPVIRLIGGLNANWQQWTYRALSFLVVSCPCALVISVPLSFFACIGGASSIGILIKGSNYLETLSKVKYVLMDKTGTVTKGVFEVSKINAINIDEQELLKYSAYAESYSSHPIAKSIVKAYNNEIEQDKISNVNVITSKGVIATIFDNKVIVGNEKLMRENNVTFAKCNEIGSIIHIAINNEYKGYIVINDTIKETSKEAINDLKILGVKKVVMLTGDKKQVAKSVAEKLNFDECHYELLPDQKLTIMQNYLSKGEIVAFVGDGINDAPTLAQADVGISMGALGSDCAIEASDLVLTDDNPKKISRAISIAKKCMRIVYENIVFSIFIKALCLALSAFGLANMWIAIIADVGVMILAVLNSIRCIKVK